nr:hypothetical protein Iba_chr12bCG17070 [Ipomoea batatas]
MNSDRSNLRTALRARRGKAPAVRAAAKLCFRDEQQSSVVRDGSGLGFARRFPGSPAADHCRTDSGGWSSAAAAALEQLINAIASIKLPPWELRGVLILGSVYVKTHMDGSAQGWRCLAEPAANASSVRPATASWAAEEWIPLAFLVSSQPPLSYDSLPNLR